MAGAVVGCLLAGFYLLRVYDMPTATFVAVGAERRSSRRSRSSLARVTPHERRRDGADDGRTRRGAGRHRPRLRRDRALRHDGARRRSGLDAALLAAVRRHDLHVLAHPRGVPDRPRARQQRRVVASRAARRARGSRSAWCSCCCGGASRGRRGRSRPSLPYWPINPELTSRPWFQFQLDLVRCVWAVLPGAMLWGASFPLALASVASPGQDAGRLVGGVYAANTVGAIVGALVASLVAHRVDRHAAGAAGADRARRRSAAALMLVPVVRRRRRARRSSPRGAARGRLATGAGALRARLERRAGARAARRVRPLQCAALRQSRRHHLRRRRDERVGGRVGAVERRPELSQRRQGAGVERAAGHAAAAHARPPHDARAAASALGARHRLRRGRDGRRRVHQPAGRARDDRRDRAARAAGRVEVLRRAQLRRRQQPEGARRRSTMRGTSC